MLSPTAGELRIHGHAVSHRSPGQLTRLRRSQIGFVFQHGHLLPFLTLEENLAVTAKNCGLSPRESADRIEILVTRLGIQALRQRKPGQVSGGERQRTAIGRALVHRPSIILADEPTASLDWENGQAVMRLLTRHAGAEGAALVTVTHDTRLVPLFDRVLYLDSGRIRTP
jgi:putative ABC transport system ATP-binding protein